MTFQDGKEPTSSKINAIGKEIAKKCRGVPLAIRITGRMLYSKHQENEWLASKNSMLSNISQEENNILPTLKLSYDVLPSHLKHCFAYCSLFPSDYEIPVERLIKLWMAQGFIQSSHENEGLEDVGYEYFKELLWRSFFQEEREDEFGVISWCKIHDLMHELAISASGTESTIIDSNEKNVDKKPRHVSFHFDGYYPSQWKIPTTLLKANKIRTFLFLNKFLGCMDEKRSKSSCNVIASNFKSLRMLRLNFMGFITLPNCLGKLKHLRYLDLSENFMERLPDWVVELQNLQTLDLSSCKCLIELPRDTKKLINLRHLILKQCYKLTHMQCGLGELTCLRTLDNFFLSKNNSMLRDNAAGLGELGRLNQLRGKLKIENLKHGKDMVSESIAANMREKERLHSLSLQWEWSRFDIDDQHDEIVLMEALEPHSNLKELVDSYMGVRFPGWLSSLINIVNLELYWRDRCEHLTPLDHLPSLKFLRVSLAFKEFGVHIYMGQWQ